MNTLTSSIKCPLCSYRGTLKLVGQHLTRLHKQSKDEVALFRSMIRINHLGMPAPEKRHMCPQCKKKFASRSGFQYHMKTSHQPKVTALNFDCPFCKEEFINQISLLDHVSECQPRNDDSQACEKEST